MKKRGKKETKAQEEMRKRLENSLPWSLSRWLRKMMENKK